MRSVVTGLKRETILAWHLILFTGNRVPCRVRTGQAEHAGSVGAVGRVECEESLGGLLKSYRREAA